MNKIEYSRLVLKRTAQSGATPTINTATTIDNTWLTTDILIGEMYANIEDDRVWLRTNNGLLELASLASGATSSYDFCPTGIKTSALSGCTSTTPIDYASSFQNTNCTASTTDFGGTIFYSHAEGFNSIASGLISHTEGNSTTASGTSSHAEGENTIAGGTNSHAEGNSTTASGDNSHAEGFNSIASASHSHVEGVNNTASGYAAHAEGQNTIASGNSSHSEGTTTIAGGPSSHAEGNKTKANGISSHSQGELTEANGNNSHAGGNGLGSVRILADGDSSFVHFGIVSASSSTGALADRSAILGGADHKINASASNSVVLGGSGITGTTANTVYVPHLNIQTGKGISFGTGATRTFIELNIGDWNMDTTFGVSVAHGLSATEWKTVRDVTAIIKDDGDFFRYPITNLDYTTGTIEGGVRVVDSTNIQLRRTTGGLFDSTSFDSTSYNRGYITFWYTPD